DSHVEIESDGHDVTGLFLPQEISRTTDFEISNSELKADAEFIERLKRAESLLCIGGKPALLRNEKVTVGLPVAATDSATKLIELSQPESISSVDQDRVRVGDVDPRFDDGRGNEHIDFVIQKLQHDLLENSFGHLTVGEGDFRFGDELPKLCGDELD